MSKEQDDARDLLEEIDSVGKDLTEWEVDFVADLIDNWQGDFEPRQIEKIQEIYEEQCT